MAKDISIDELLTASKLNFVSPAADPEIIEAILTDAPTAFPAAGLDNPIKIAHFLGQVAAESSGLRRLDENLNYSTAERLIAVFGSKHFPNAAFARGFVNSPKKLANYVYANRNGNRLPDDGYTYRGSGLIQLTGRGNYASVGKIVGIPLGEHPELCRQPDSALKVALGYWQMKKINAVATDASDQTIAAVTKRINPALAGLSDRRLYFKRALKILTLGDSVRVSAKARDSLESLLAGNAARAGMESVGRGEERSLSGPHWVDFFPTSRSVDDLAAPFRERLVAFLGALRAAGATVNISATLRPAQRAYLMHYAWMIANREIKPNAIPAMRGVPIEWSHPTAAASIAAARKMVAAYQIAFRPALKSRHTQARAIDMTISWSGDLSIRRKDGSVVVIATAPRNGGNSRLVAVGHDYGVIKLMSDPPHWSDDGH